MSILLTTLCRHIAGSGRPGTASVCPAQSRWARAGPDLPGHRVESLQDMRTSPRGLQRSLIPTSAGPPTLCQHGCRPPFCVTGPLRWHRGLAPVCTEHRGAGGGCETQACRGPLTSVPFGLKGGRTDSGGRSGWSKDVSGHPGRDCPPPAPAPPRSGSHPCRALQVLFPLPGFPARTGEERVRGARRSRERRVHSPPKREDGAQHRVE